MMEITIVETVNGIVLKTPEIYECCDFPEYQVKTVHYKVYVYAPERGGDFELSFSINFKSEKPKKRRKQLLKTIERYLNVEEIMLIP